MSLNKVVEFLNANPVQYLATVGRDGKAKCRPLRRRFLLSHLLAEAPEYRQLAVPDDAAGQKQLLRALLNVFKDLDKEIYTRLLTA